MSFLIRHAPRSLVSSSSFTRFMNVTRPSVASVSSSTFLSSRSFSSTSSSAAVPFTLVPGDKNTVDGVVAERREKGKYVQEAIIRQKHHIDIDERGLHGGLDIGPSPYDFLITALGACTSMTIRIVAERKGIVLPPLSITVMHSKKSHTDLAELQSGEGAKGLIDLFEITLAVQPNNEVPNDDLKTQLLEIAERCPVHKTLGGNPKTVIRTKWA